LRRTKINALEESQSQELENFDTQKVLDIKNLFPSEKCISINPLVEEELRHGRKVMMDFS